MHCTSQYAPVSEAQIISARWAATFYVLITQIPSSTCRLNSLMAISGMIPERNGHRTCAGLFIYCPLTLCYVKLRCFHMLRIPLTRSSCQSHGSSAWENGRIPRLGWRRCTLYSGDKQLTTCTIPSRTGDPCNLARTSLCLQVDISSNWFMLGKRYLILVSVLALCTGGKFSGLMLAQELHWLVSKTATRSKPALE